jgi:hypothetical protein
MANIVINEISQNYTFNIASSQFAEVAFPIAAAWGPGYVDPETLGQTADEVLEETQFIHFPATQEGLEAYVATFRGPVSNYRALKDYSYFIGMTLLTSGYDILVCRVSNGNKASGTITVGSGVLSIKAKYPGSFGNSISAKLTKVSGATSYFNLIIYVSDANSTKTAVENFVFTVADNDSDTIPTLNEIANQSNYVTLVGTFTDADAVGTTNTVTLTSGNDTNLVVNITGEAVMNLTLAHTPVLPKTLSVTVTVGSTAPTYIDKNGDGKLMNGSTQAGTINYSTGVIVFDPAITSPDSVVANYQTTDSVTSSTLIRSAATTAAVRYGGTSGQYYSALYALSEASPAPDIYKAIAIAQMEWVYDAAYRVYDILQDKLNYSPQRLISPGWDDQNINQFVGTPVTRIAEISPLHKKIMQTAYLSRCATGLIDIPQSCPRSAVYNEDTSTPGYAQILSRDAFGDDKLYNTHSALFAPWGNYRFVGMSKQSICSPSIFALLIQRAMILNQPIQYEWALPTNRRQNLAIGELAYKIPKKVMDVWQSLDGTGVNVIADIPSLGTTLWGNSTLYEVPPATYQALANLSTRYLFNAVENIAYLCGIAITYQYNNLQAYNKFYAGVTPLLDTMKNVGAIEDYKVSMSADINGLDQVNANSIIGKIYLIVSGVVNDITIDLIALPPGTDLNQYE